MASQTEFLLSGDPAAAHRVVTDALTAQGFATEPYTNGWLKATRGSAAKTALFGGLAGNNLHITFLLFLGIDPEGRPTARLDRDLTMGALKGGAIGASKTAAVYVETRDAIGAAATQAGVYVAHRELA